MIERLFRVDDDLDRRFPGLRQRAGLYRPVLTRAVDVVIMIVAFAVTMSAWGLDLYTALGPAARGELLQSILVIALVVVIGVSLWEFASGAIQRALSGTYADRKSTRLNSSH